LPATTALDGSIVAGPAELLESSNVDGGAIRRWDYSKAYNAVIAAITALNPAMPNYAAAVQLIATHPYSTWDTLIPSERDRYSVQGWCFGEPRLAPMYDDLYHRYYQVTTAFTATAPHTAHGYCLGAGTAEDSTLAPAWTWRVLDTGVPVDGARITFNDTHIMLGGVGSPIFLCDKATLTCTATNNPVRWNDIPVVAANGTGSRLLYVGIQPNTTLLHVQSIDPLTGVSLDFPILYGDVSEWNGYTSPYLGTDDDGNPNPPSNAGMQLSDAVLDPVGGFLWVAFMGKCPVSGAHACVGALKIDVDASGTPLVGAFVFDAPGSTLDGYLPFLTLTASGTPWMTWTSQSPTTAQGFALGVVSDHAETFNPVTPIYLQAARKVERPGGAIPPAGQARVDFTGISYRNGWIAALGFAADAQGNFFSPSVLFQAK
jgi:hypothetical protein